MTNNIKHIFKYSNQGTLIIEKTLTGNFMLISKSEFFDTQSDITSFIEEVLNKKPFNNLFFEPLDTPSSLVSPVSVENELFFTWNPSACKLTILLTKIASRLFCMEVTESGTNQATWIGEIEDVNTQKILENSPDVHLIINYSTESIDYISQAVRKILGYYPEQFIGKHPDEFFRNLDPEDQEKYMKLWIEIPELEKQDIYLFNSEFRLIDSQSSVKWVSLYHTLVTENNSPKLLICHIRDISEYKSVEIALRQSESRLNDAIDASQDGLWDYNSETNIFFCSPRLYEIIGQNKTIFVPELNRLEELLHPFDKESCVQKIKKFLSTNEKSLHSELRIKTGSNQYIWTEIRAKKFTNPDNSLRIVGTLSDITLRKESELDILIKNAELENAHNKLHLANQALEKAKSELEEKHLELISTHQILKENEELFRQLAENIGDVFWLRDDKQILFINSSFDKVWGQDRNLVLKDPQILSKWIHPEDTNSFEAWLNKTDIPPGKPRIEQYRIIKPNGEVRWLWSRVFPVLDENNHIYRIAGIATDITENKEFEETLLIAKKQAQDADRLKSLFLANISHEIRTPMNGIIGFAELISKPETSDEVKTTYQDIIKKSSEQLTRIIDDIIDFAKIESNQIKIVPNKFNLNKLIINLRIFYQNYLSNNSLHNINLLAETPLPDSEANIIADEQRIRRILNNLIDNAIKYTNEGFVRFGYELKDDVVEFYVHDSGIGIEPDMNDLIFERFRQADEGNNRRYGGTGLGLPICKGLINLMGGTIWVKSKPKLGSTFYFRIPISNDTSDIHKNKTIIQKQYFWPNKVILVAEDDDINYAYMKALLTPTKVGIIRAKDGREAVKICSTTPLDLILMDIQLPILNGLQATEQIRGFNTKIPIIAQTAFALNQDRTKCLSAGCTEYVSKPFKSELIYQLIDSLINQSF